MVGSCWCCDHGRDGASPIRTCTAAGRDFATGFLGAEMQVKGDQTLHGTMYIFPRLFLQENGPARRTPPLFASGLAPASALWSALVELR